MTAPGASQGAAPDFTGLPTVGINGVSLLSPRTGIGQYTYHLAREMQALLPERPWLFYGTGWSHDLRDAPVPGVDAVKNGIKRFVPQPYRVMRALQQAAFTAGARGRIGLYHDPNFLAFRYRGPTVVSVHDLSWVRHPETQPADRVAVMNRLMPDIVRRADHLVASSEFVRGEIVAHFGVAPARVSTVLLGVSPAFRPRAGADCAAPLARLGLRYGGYVLAVGTLEPRKNLATALAAYARLPGALRKRYRLVLAGMKGWGDASFSPALRALADAGEAILTGYVPQDELPLLYAGARLMVYPSLYEGFGLPPVEAMASGVPVIVSDRACLPEVTGGAAAVVPALDDRRLSAAMDELLQDEAAHGRRVAAGLLQAAKFSWRQCAIETATVYQNVIKTL